MCRDPIVNSRTQGRYHHSNHFHVFFLFFGLFFFQRKKIIGASREHTIDCSNPQLKINCGPKNPPSRISSSCWSLKPYEWASRAALTLSHVRLFKVGGLRLSRYFTLELLWNEGCVSVTANAEGVGAQLGLYWKISVVWELRYLWGNRSLCSNKRWKIISDERRICGLSFPAGLYYSSGRNKALTGIWYMFV